MNPAVSFLISGDSLYFGALLILIAIAMSPYSKPQWSRRCRNVAAWIGLAMVVMACPPFPWIVDAIFALAFGSWFIQSNWYRNGRVWARSQLVVTAVFVSLLLALPAIELSHRKMPKIVGVPTDHLVVIGDSISSGIDSRVPAWPLVMQQTTGIAVKSLARPGAETIEAQAMAKEVTQGDRVVLLEIGGNDMLAGVPSGEFGGALDLLLSKIVAPGRTVVMFELPLLPHQMAYGQIQRRMAAKYGVWLIPKRMFVNVIGGANATSDGLHLSEEGTRRMAALVVRALSAVLKPSA